MTPHSSLNSARVRTHILHRNAACPVPSASNAEAATQGTGCFRSVCRAGCELTAPRGVRLAERPARGTASASPPPLPRTAHQNLPPGESRLASAAMRACPRGPALCDCDAVSSRPGLTGSRRLLSSPRPPSEQLSVARIVNALLRDFGLTILLCVFKDFLLFARSAYSSGRFRKLETRPRQVLFGVPVKASQGSEGNSTCELAGGSETRGQAARTGPL